MYLAVPLSLGVAIGFLLAATALPDLRRRGAGPVVLFWVGLSLCVFWPVGGIVWAVALRRASPVAA